jgi:diadenylate cyclase
VELVWVLGNLNINAVVDILIVGLLFFGISFFIRGTQGVALLRGVIFVVAGVVLISNIFELTALRWLLNGAITVMAVALPIIFQPELRRGLERLGRGSMVLGNRQPAESLRTQLIDDISQAAERLSERRHGALIILQRDSSLQEYVRTGIELDSKLTPELLLTVFWPKTELHDGAVIVDERGRIAAAAAVLPLSASRNLPSRKLGTRHRAALGMSEVSDAICIVVSEETGRIAITDGGRMIPRLDAKRLKTILNAIYGSDRKQDQSPLGRLRTQFEKLLDDFRKWRESA